MDASISYARLRSALRQRNILAVAGLLLLLVTLLQARPIRCAPGARVTLSISPAASSTAPPMQSSRPRGFM